jgi:hypothetical protein
MFSKISGFALIITGLVMIIYTRINLVTKEKVFEIGPVEVSREKNNPVKWSPVLGAVLLVGGILILAFDKKESREH